MPAQHTFEILAPREFEFLCRDLVQRKLSEEIGKRFLFNNFSEGPDDGIDAVFENKEQKIILQCKRYNNYASLRSALKSEIPKVIKLKPTRYIIATSCHLTQKQVYEIYEQFQPYIDNVSDIIGREMLNNLLTNYSDIELNHPRLFLNNSSTLRHILEANVYNQSFDKLRQYQNISKFYVPDYSFQEALKILSEKRFVIISGEPGVGKSTLAGMISLYYVQNDYEFIFIRRSISEAEGGVWDSQKKQIFLFDDFLGSTTFEGFARNEDRQLLDFIRRIANSSNKFLLITTREYIFKQAEIKYPELKKLNFSKSMIWQRKFTSAFKINILYNYLYHSVIEYKHLESIVFNQNYLNIIHHTNFTPRLIYDYIERLYNKHDPPHSFYLGLKKYLDDPYYYWEEIFLKLNNNAQTLLLILAITEEPAIEDLLFETFIRVGEHRKIFEKGYERDKFNLALEELSESFISLSNNPKIFRNEDQITSLDYSLLYNPFYASRFIEFQNPSIKDFTVNYLRKRDDLISIILKGATLFNQLFFIFTSAEKDSHIDDSESEYPFTVGKILLPLSIQELVINKIIQEFDTLPIVKVRRIEWKEGFSSFHLNENMWNNRMDKLWLLCSNYPLEHYKLVKEFVINKYLQLINENQLVREDSENDNIRYFSLEERITQTDIIHIIQKFVKLDPRETINNYYKNIKFAKEFIFLHYLEELFPEAYKEIITPNLKKIGEQIKYMIYDDIDYYLHEGSQEADEAIDELIDIDLENLIEIYGFKLSKKFKRDINEMAGKELFFINSKKSKKDILDDVEEKPATEEISEKEVINTQKFKDYKFALNRLIPNWDDVLDDEEPEDIQYVGKVEPKELYNLFNHVLTTSFHNESFQNFLQSASYHLYTNDSFIFRKESFENLLPNDIKNLSIDTFKEFIIQKDIWYKFTSKNLQVFLSSQYILNLPKHERVKVYNNFLKMYDEIFYENIDILLKFCHYADRQLLSENFIVPLFQEELFSFLKDDEEATTITFLRKYNLDFSFEYDEEDKRYLIDSYSSLPMLIEEVAILLNWENTDISYEIGDCFNISRATNSLVLDYMKKHCPIENGQYSIDITKELFNKEFRKILVPSGITQIVHYYIKELQKYLDEVSSAA